MEQTLSKFKDIFREASEQITGKEDRKLIKPWMTKEIIEAMDERRKVKNKCEDQYKRLDKEI